MNPNRVKVIVLIAAVFLAGWLASHLSQPASAQATVETRPLFGTFAVAPTNDDTSRFLVAAPDGHLWLVATGTGRIQVLDEQSLAAHK
jgi:hypothetical protein